MSGATAKRIEPGSEGATEVGSSVAGRYVVLSQLGAGGMGVVCRVRDEVTGRILGLKRLLSAGAGRRRRKLEALFEREYHTLVRLKHPRIIEVYEYGLTDEGPFYTMELLEGGDLHERSPLPWRDACRILCDVASSLALLHAHGLLHRDVAPRNIRLTDDGRGKLIDFGALSAIGPALDVVGTPTCMAPEVLQRGLLDQRTDLFALGVVGYLALTGKHVFPARRLEDLPALWTQRPAPPSTYVPELPSEIDNLILSMVDVDPMGRPGQAAHVIDQLCASAGLDVAAYDRVADSYLASHQLVGRRPELQWLEQRIAGALEGHGAELIVSGVTGIGKSRLLREIGLDARLRGMRVIFADAQTTTGYFGLVVALGLSLLEQGGSAAREAALPVAGLIAQLSAALKERLGEVALEPLVPNAAERQSRFQAALLRWFLDAAQGRPLLVVVDNLHAADESSATFLALLGQEARGKPLLMLCSLRMGDLIRAPQPVDVLQARCEQRLLAAIDREACEELVRSLFGDVDNGPRIAKLLYDKSAGNPQHFMELAQLLARKGIAKYVGGAWVLPTHVSSDELPDRLEDVFEAKLMALHPDARALAEALCIHPKPIAIELCIASAEGQSEAQAYGLLEALVSAQVLATASDIYQFVHEGLRTTLLDGLSPARAQAVHRNAARVLDGLDDLEQRMQRGWHLLSAGEERAGADLLASTSRAFLYSAGAREESQSVIAALRAALDVYERHGRSAHERAALLFPLVLLAYYCPDDQIILEVVPKALQLGLDITGIGLAQRLSRWLGKDQALRVGMWIAAKRFARERTERGVQMTLEQAVMSFSSLWPASVGAYGCHYDTPGAERACAMGDALALFADDQLPSVIYIWVQGQLNMVHGLESRAHVHMMEAYTRLDAPAIRAVLGDAHWRSLRGGALMMVGLTSCYRGDDSPPKIAATMEGLGMRLWALVADQIRLLYHCYRGETQRVQHYRRRVEWAALQGGPTWHTELYWPAAMLNGELLCGDTIAVRRSHQQLERIAQTCPSLQVHADCARAAYLSLRGERQEAIALYEQILPRLPLRRSVAWLPTRGYFAATLNRVGEHARAKQLLLETFEHVDDQDRATRVLCFEARRQLALAEHALGNRAVAKTMLERLLEEYAVDANPLLLGLLHHARAACALKAGDEAEFKHHLQHVETYFRSTENPLLVARAARLRQRGAGAVHADGHVATPTLDGGSGTGERVPTMHTLDELSSAPDRPRYALRLLMERASATGGRLYLFDGTRLQLIAAEAFEQPVDELEQRLLNEVQRSQAILDVLNAPESTTHMLDSVPAGPASLRPASARAPRSARPANDQLMRSVRPSRPARQSQGPAVRTHMLQAHDERHRLAVLTAEQAGQTRSIGGVILALSAEGGLSLDVRLLRAVGQALFVGSHTPLSR